MPGDFQEVYHGIKTFVGFITEAIHVELKMPGVTVTSLISRATKTDFFRKAHMTEFKTFQDSELANPGNVARDGYEAMLAGNDMVASGFKNKFQVVLGIITPDAGKPHACKKHMNQLN